MGQIFILDGPLWSIGFYLDGDGVETIEASQANQILFDHDGDGLKTGTEWIKPDDGFLVMDSQTIEIHSYAALGCLCCA